MAKQVSMPHHKGERTRTTTPIHCKAGHASSGSISELGELHKFRPWHTATRNISSCLCGRGPQSHENSVEVFRFSFYIILRRCSLGRRQRTATRDKHGRTSRELHASLNPDLEVSALLGKSRARTRRKVDAGRSTQTNERKNHLRRKVYKSAP